MTLIRTGTTLLGVLAITGLVWSATAQDKKAKPDKPEKVEKLDKADPLFVSADQAKFKDVVPGVSAAVLSGDPDKGAYSRFTKFAPGTPFAMHTHSSEMRIVVIKGAYLYKPEKGEERRVSSGCYLKIPAGEKHASGGDEKEGALFYEESTGKFDLVFVDKK